MGLLYGVYKEVAKAKQADSTALSRAKSDILKDKTISIGKDLKI